MDFQTHRMQCSISNWSIYPEWQMKKKSFFFTVRLQRGILVLPKVNLHLSKSEKFKMDWPLEFAMWIHSILVSYLFQQNEAINEIIRDFHLKFHSYVHFSIYLIFNTSSAQNNQFNVGKYSLFDISNKMSAPCELIDRKIFRRHIKYRAKSICTVICVMKSAELNDAVVCVYVFNLPAS